MVTKISVWIDDILSILGRMKEEINTSSLITYKHSGHICKGEVLQCDFKGNWPSVKVKNIKTRRIYVINALNIIEVN